MNQIVILVNNKTCGYCRKFAPVIERVVKSMSPQAQLNVTVADRNDPDGAGWFSKLSYRGGIPCVVALKDGEPFEQVPGYKPDDKLAPLLAKLMMA